jgi:NAD(P)H-flavin reductase/hemoglobin-like flavoprotein
LDTLHLKKSWQTVASNGDEVPLYFYSTLFLLNPEVRQLFPLSMAGQRDRLVTALGHIVSSVDDTDTVLGFTRQLGRDHRKFDVVEKHYPLVGQALLATLAHFLGTDWTPQLAKDWEAAYALVANTMVEGVRQVAKTEPPWWPAEIKAHERRGIDIAVLTLAPYPRLTYQAGQSIAVCTELRPNLWRYYSPANAQRDDGTIDLHIRLAPGGPVSTALVHLVQVGDVVRLGAPIGAGLGLPAGGSADLVLIAGGTGLAPLKAIVEQVSLDTHHTGLTRQVRLYVGARTAAELYDLPALSSYAEECHWLQVIPVLSADVPGRNAEGGFAVDAALRHGIGPGHEVYVCGTDDMVAGSIARLRHAGVADAQIYHEQFTDRDIWAGIGGRAHE